MDETIRIYNPARFIGEALPVSGKPVTASYVKAEDQEQPKKTREKRSHLKQKESKWKFFCDKVVWKDVLESKQGEIRELQQKYTWFPIMYNWLVVMVVAALFVSFGIWSINIRTERTAVAYAKVVAEQKDAEHQAYIAQLEADRRAAEESIENQQKKNSTVKSKLGYGSHNFKDNKNYSESDFMTLYQCLDNRLKNAMYAGMTIEEIAFQEGQFIASYDTNPVQDWYYNLAMKSEKLKYEREAEGRPEPIGSDYVYTIYTDHGLYLANDPNAPAYTWWHYSESK